MKPQNPQNGPSQRQLRVGEQIRHIMSETLARRNFYNEELIDMAGGITVTEVRPSPDLRQATAFVISLGGADMDKILPALNDSAKIFQKEINSNATLKFTPRIRFKEDVSFSKVQKLDELLSTIKYSDQETE